jgi:hypothetical protein
MGKLRDGIKGFVMFIWEIDSLVGWKGIVEFWDGERLGCLMDLNVRLW